MYKTIWVILALVAIFMGLMIYKGVTFESLRALFMVQSFESCEREGYAILETYPRQCRTPDGRVFSEKPTVLP